jgi:aldehyde dehydrogenase (NAD+)
MKRFTLELGGKSPDIILDDADFSKAIPMVVNACFLNNGQACITASRLFVPDNRLDEVKRLIKAAVEKIKVGDPNDKTVMIGTSSNPEWAGKEVFWGSSNFWNRRQSSAIDARP